MSASYDVRRTYYVFGPGRATLSRMPEDIVREQAVAILRTLQDARVTFVAGPDADGWFVRTTDEGNDLVFRGADLTDALAQFTTWLALS